MIVINFLEVKSLVLVVQACLDSVNERFRRHRRGEAKVSVIFVEILLVNVSQATCFWSVRLLTNDTDMMGPEIVVSFAEPSVVVLKVSHARIASDDSASRALHGLIAASSVVNG